MVAHPSTDTRLSFSWTAPDNNGSPITRYDISGGSSLATLRWSFVVQTLLRTTTDVEKLFGYPAPGGLGIGDVAGAEELCKLIAGESCLALVGAESTTFSLEALLPGQDYYFTVRAINKNGKGDFSNIFGPITTRRNLPAEVANLEILNTGQTSADFAFRLPYSCNAPIVEARVRLVRVEGPLSADEVDAHTGEPHPHLALREWAFDIKSPVLDLAEDLSGRRRLWAGGLTPALHRAFEEQGATSRHHDLGHVPSLADPTGFRRASHVPNLRPGTRYELSWECRNACGWSSTSAPLAFHTKATVPDTPEMMLIPSL